MLIVETFNNAGNAHGHDEFLHPDDVKDKFNEVFDGQNKSAVVTRLMVRAIEEEERAHRSAGFVERLRQIRARGRPVTEEEIRRARGELRE